jgi:hypothetical protein
MRFDLFCGDLCNKPFFWNVTLGTRAFVAAQLVDAKEKVWTLVEREDPTGTLPLQLCHQYLEWKRLETRETAQSTNVASSNTDPPLKEDLKSTTPSSSSSSSSSSYAPPKDVKSGSAKQPRVELPPFELERLAAQARRDAEQRERSRKAASMKRVPSSAWNAYTRAALRSTSKK